MHSKKPLSLRGPMNTATPLNRDLHQNIICHKKLSPKAPEELKTPITKLNGFLKSFHFQGSLTEWGVPSGSIARLLPAIVAQALEKECLWITDTPVAQIYPNSWTGLGFNLNSLHFIHEEEPLASIRTVIHENTFPFLVIDCKQRLQTSDLHFLAQHCRQKKTTIFLFRHFYLSNRNGNPFSSQRINSSYSIGRKSFQLSVIKGSKKKRSLPLKFSEVLCG